MQAGSGRKSACRDCENVYRCRENDLDAVRVLLEAARGLIKAVKELEREGTVRASGSGCKSDFESACRGRGSACRGFKSECRGHESTCL